MLQEAHRLKEDGIDVVIGLVETHKRKETEVLLNGLEIIPRLKIMYRDIAVEEMDLKKILARNPQVVLVDELAHTNIPGSSNSKRYQDIEELLDAGIHVISTLNVQHLESLYEIVEQMTGVKVKERVPDYIITNADQIVNVDITTEDLRQRLEEGKVYINDRMVTALENFFKQSNLEQLRELTLRELAAQIDFKHRETFYAEPSLNPDQIMVCLSSDGPNSEELLRFTSRLAGKLNRNWYAVYVQTMKEQPANIDPIIKQKLADSLSLAKQLGGTVFIYKGEDVVSTILQFAKEYQVGHIVIGSPGKKNSWWTRISGRQGIVDRLIAADIGSTLIIHKTAVENPTIIKVPKEIVPNHLDKELHDKNGSPFENIHVTLWDYSIEKDIAIKQLVSSFEPHNQDLQNIALIGVMEREKQGGTFVGEDLMIPHARINGIEKPYLAIGINKLGVLDDNSNRTARVVILFLSPINQPQVHIDILKQTSKMAQDDQWWKRILNTESEDHIYQIIQEWIHKA
jgi:two-component system, OmpR family, sensor histidine kinase KdpD